MSAVGQPERTTQNRVIALCRDELGYRTLGDWTDRDGSIAAVRSSRCDPDSHPRRCGNTSRECGTC